MDHYNGFVADVYDHTRAATEPLVRSEVEREFAAKLDEALAVDQKRIRREIEREVEKATPTTPLNSGDNHKAGLPARRLPSDRPLEWLTKPLATAAALSYPNE